MSANVTDKHLCNVRNMDIENYNVPDNTKVATVRPIYKEKSRSELENYRPASLFLVLTIFFLYIFQPTEKATAQTMC